MRQTWLIAIVAIAVLFVAGMPAVQAAVQKVRVQGKAKVADSGGGTIDAKNLGDLGLLEAPGSNGAVAVRNFAGGGGLLGAGDCDAATPGRPDAVTVPASQDTIITAIIITGTDAAVGVRAPDLDPLLGPGPIVTFRVDAGQSNEFVGLGNGLNVFPSELVFECAGTSGQFVLLGQ
jgi:hypothetical protein